MVFTSSLIPLFFQIRKLRFSGIEWYGRDHQAASGRTKIGTGASEMSHHVYTATWTRKEHRHFLNDSLPALGGAGIFFFPPPATISETHHTAVFLTTWFVNICTPQPEKTFQVSFGSQSNLSFTTTLEMFLFEHIRNVCQERRFSEVGAGSVWDLQEPPVLAPK